MPYDTIYEGQRIRAEVKYRLNGVPVDPTIAQAYIKKPSGSVISLTYPNADFIRVSLGVFAVYHTMDESGTWWVRAEGLGVIDGVDEVAIQVEPSAF